MLRIPFLRNILLLSLLIAVVLPLYEVLVIHPAYEELLTEETEDEAIRYVRHLARTLALDRAVLEKGEVPPGIAEEVGSLRGDARLIKLKVFSADGTVVFSTEAGEVGTVNEKSYFRDIVARGGIYSKVVEKDAYTAEGQPVRQDVVETYVPLMEDGRFAGAVEIYYDVTASRERIAQLGTRSTLLLFIIACGLLFSILIALIRAKSSIEAQQKSEEALRRLNDELEARVAERSAELLRTLTESETAKEKIDAILRSVGDGLLAVDRRQRVLLMNEVAAGLFGVSAGQALGQPLSAFIRESGLRETLEAALEPLRGGASFEFELPAPAGPPKVFQGRTSPIQGVAEQGQGMLLLVHDVTEERQLESMKSEFVAMVTHELHTPLATIMGYAELLANQAQGQFSVRQQQEFLDIIQEKGESLARIVNDLLDLSRIESGQTLTLERSVFRLDEALEQVVAQQYRTDDRHRFEVALDGGPLEVPGDRGRIVQVLENLLSNAVKYSPDGGRVGVAAERRDGFCRVTVEDEGVGMTPPQVAKVFDRFYRVDSSDTAIRGTGLGLSIAKHIVEAHGGKIWVQSEAGIGTVVRFTLPLGSGDDLPG